MNSTGCCLTGLDTGEQKTARRIPFFNQELTQKTEDKLTRQRLQVFSRCYRSAALGTFGMLNRVAEASPPPLFNIFLSALCDLLSEGLLVPSYFLGVRIDRVIS